MKKKYNNNSFFAEKGKVIFTQTENIEIFNQYINQKN